jgi:nucleoside-diphosphate-sugar epimerase
MNIGSGAETSIIELAGAVAGVTGAEVEPAYGPAVAGEVRHSCADIALAAKLLDYSPEFTLEEGLKKTADFYKATSVP